MAEPLLSPESTATRVTCRRGFVAESPDMDQNVAAYQEHDCAQTAWEWFVDHLFSFYGFMLALLVASTVAQVFGHAHFF